MPDDYSCVGKGEKLEGSGPLVHNRRTKRGTSTTGVTARKASQVEMADVGMAGILAFEDTEGYIGCDQTQAFGASEKA